MKKILIAEDDPSSRELLVEILQIEDYEVAEAANGHEAVQKIEEAAPDLAILDIQMPLLDGYGAVGRLRGNPRFAALPVIALTAYAMQGGREKVLEAGFTAYLTKPVDFAALRSTLREYLPGN